MRLWAICLQGSSQVIQDRMLLSPSVQSNRACRAVNTLLNPCTGEGGGHPLLTVNPSRCIYYVTLRCYLVRKSFRICLGFKGSLRTRSVVQPVCRETETETDSPEMCCRKKLSGMWMGKLGNFPSFCKPVLVYSEMYSGNTYPLLHIQITDSVKNLK